MRGKPGLALRWRILIGALGFLLIVVVVIHLYLETWLLGHVNRVLADIPGYQGHAQSIDVELYRGAYRIHKLIVNKKEGKIPTPFLDIDVVDLSIQWGALFHGRIVSDVTLTRPVINFAVKDNAKQTGTEADWNKPIKDLMPIDINEVQLEDGSITYQDFSSTPRVNIYMHHMNGELRNLRNIEDKANALPSTLSVRGDSIGGGKMRVKGKLNILRRVPDMDMKLALENVSLPALNDYSQAYAAFAFRKGDFTLYSHLVVKDNQVSGYVKPIMRHIGVDVLKSENPLEVAWSAVIAGVLEIFTNHAKDQFATRADLEGNLDNVDTDTWTTIGGILRNAFIKALSRGFDETGAGDLFEKEEE